MSSTTEFNATVKAAIEQASDDLRALSLSIHGKPELCWEEHHAHDELTAYMEKQEGWTMTRKAYDLDTAWRAEWGTEGPLVGFNSEMDALKGIGHACGHNLIAIAGCAAALGVVAALKEHRIKGRVVLLGTPAEEAGGGKCLMLERGAYEGMDACLMVHPGPKGNGAKAMTSTCRSGVTVEYSGRSAHAGGAPEKGINALDAAVLGYSNVSALRQQTPADTRIHGIIAGGENWSVNAIPASSQLAYGMRASSAQELAILIPRVVACFKASAMATGCTFTTSGQQLYLELRHSKGLVDVFAEYGEKEWGDEGYETRGPLETSGSTDFGNVTYAVPGLHPMFFLPDAEDSDFPHGPTFTAAAALPSSHVAALRAATGIAVAGLKVIVDEAFRRQIRKEWEEDIRNANAAEAVRTIAEALPMTGEPVKGDFCSCVH